MCEVRHASITIPPCRGNGSQPLRLCPALQFLLLRAATELRSRPGCPYGVVRMAQQHGWVEDLAAVGFWSSQMEHRWGRRLSANLPVRLRCVEALDSGCRCLGCIENVSATGALIRTELGICPAPTMVVETLTSTLGLEERELPACVVRAPNGEIAVEWIELASTAVSALLTETMLTSGAREESGPRVLGRVPFCARAPAATV
jgi:hypothetical protein